MYKVLMTDNIFPDLDIETKALKSIGAKLILAEDATPECLQREGKDSDAILNIYAELPRTVISSLEKCKVIVRMGIGLNTIDIDAANDKGIMVANVPDYCLDEVADHTFSLLLAGIRKICYLNQQVRAGIWDVNTAKPIYPLKEMILGLLGFGNIAQKVAKRARAFGIKTWAYDPYVPQNIFKQNNVKQITDLVELISGVDILSLHVPLTRETENIINLTVMEKMKSNAFIINTSRGPLINDNDLYFALKNGIIAGAALDVLKDEPPKFPIPLCELDNVIITPHAAFYSEASMPKLRKRAVGEVITVLKGGIPRNWVNKASLKQHLNSPSVDNWEGR